MRVHLGCDHAGLDLKAHLVAWLTDHGYEPVDHGPFVYDALDDYPVFCLRAAEAVAAEPGSLGVVIGGSGNGEQMAANKVKGIRSALVWSEETADAGPRAQRRPGHRGRRPDAHGRGDDPVRRGLPVHAVQRRGAARPPHRHAGRLRAHRRAAAAAAVRPVGHSMPEGHTLHRLARDLDAAFGGRRVAVSSPQGRFAESAALVDGAVRAGAEAAGKHLFVELDGERVMHVHLGLIGTFDVHTGVDEVPAARGPGPAAARHRDARHAYADLRGAIVCDLVTPERRAEVVARLGPDPLRARRRPGARLGAGSAGASARSATC